jgi:hypothetical protein
VIVKLENIGVNLNRYEIKSCNSTIKINIYGLLGLANPAYQCQTLIKYYLCFGFLSASRISEPINENNQLPTLFRLYAELITGPRSQANYSPKYHLI